jgi:ADP-heptose:LPS heptosyltransferase
LIQRFTGAGEHPGGGGDREKIGQRAGKPPGQQEQQNEKRPTLFHGGDNNPAPQILATQKLVLRLAGPAGFRFPISFFFLHTPRVSAAPPTPSPFTAFCARQAAALGYVLRVVLPVMLRTGKRPVIFSRRTGMGDIICSVGPARELMKRHPGATFIYNCHPDFAAVPRLAGIAERVTTLEAIGVVGHRYRWLLGGFYHFAHGDDTPGQVARGTMLAEFCQQFGLPVVETHPALAVSAETERRVAALLAEKKLSPDALILLHPGPSWTVKEWPLAHWTALVAALRERGFTNIAQLGVGRYMNFGQVAVDAIPGTVSLVDALSVEECLATIARAKLFIGIDSGLLHLAACTRTPAVAVWGPTSPQFFYAPELRENFVVSTVACQGCYHRLPRLHWVTGCPHDIECMRTLPVAGVLAACRRQLEATR